MTERGVVWESEVWMARDVRENPGLYQALADGGE